MSYKVASIPVEVFESGKSEEYIEKTKAYQQAQENYAEAYQTWKTLLKKTEEQVASVVFDNRINYIPSVVTFKANHNWRGSLLIEELSKQLVEASGQLEVAVLNVLEAKEDVKKIYPGF